MTIIVAVVVVVAVAVAITRELTIRQRFAPRRQTWQWVDWVEYFAFRGIFDRYERTRAHTVRTSSRFLAGTTQPRTH